MDFLGCRSRDNMKYGVASPSRRPFDPMRSQEKSLKSLTEEIKNLKTEFGNLETKDLFICTKEVSMDIVVGLGYEFEQITNLINKITSYRDAEHIKCERFKHELNAFCEGRLEDGRISQVKFRNKLMHLYSFAEIATDKALEANKEIYRKVSDIWNYMKINKMNDFDHKKFQGKEIVMNDGTVIEVNALIALGKQVRKISKVHKRIIEKMETWENPEEKSKITDIFKKEPLAKELIGSFESERQQLLMLIEACKSKEQVNNSEQSNPGDQRVNNSEQSNPGDQRVNNSEQSNPGDQRVNNSRPSNPGDQRVNNSRPSNPEERKFRNNQIVCEAVNHLNTLLCELSPSIQDPEYVQHLHEAFHAQQAVQTELKDFNSRSKAYYELEARKQKLEQDIIKSESLAMCLDKYLDHLNPYHNALQGEIQQGRSVPKEPLPIDILIRNEVSYKQKERNLQRNGFPQMRERGSSQDREERVRTLQRRESGSQDREEWGRTSQRSEKGSSQDIEEWERISQRMEKGSSQDIEEWERISQKKKGKGIPQDGEKSNRIQPNAWKNGKDLPKVTKQAGREEGVVD